MPFDYTQKQINKNDFIAIIHPIENITHFQINPFTTSDKIRYASHAILNQIAEPQNSTNLLVANASTPNLNRAIFVCSTRTPQEFNQSKIGSVTLLSMVACSGKGIALCCVPQVAVSEPVTRYRHKASELQAVTSENILVELSAMIYKYLCSNRTRPNFNLEKITITANSEENARHSLSADYRIIALIARINPIYHRHLTLSPNVQGGIYA